ncbi:precorrin-3B C(17)-methyltransferase [Synechococcus sp. RSCCF101]|uniref:precorrin-3B C(17)-methyltransferase n=1 Tax=Synechococcus sp. RSCCF101 TaxID=2511069 RepID=UPI001244EC6C|nr:precorrin-3B C(17)-methyltransferase [Synechococcus sp. RSCCF101]QEY32209.1 precorrin-3B C(17)-methyltransferase [Synechococcus sp. RSCCF101]
MPPEPSRSGGLVLGLALSARSRSALSQLQAGGVISAITPPEARAAAELAQHWQQASAFVIAGAVGAVTRLIAPHLSDKHNDPAVVVIDPAGRFAIPVLGGHRAGGESLCRAVAACLGGTAVSTGSSGGEGNGLPLDCFGRDWGWRRGSGPWDQLMKRAAAGQDLTVRQEGGLDLWRRLPSAVGESAGSDADGETGPAADLVIGAELNEGCRWHPPLLWIGVGCERDSSAGLIERAIDEALASANLAAAAVAGAASLDLKGDEAGLLHVLERRGWPLKLFPSSDLAAVAVPTPSAEVARAVGTASVAEASALLAAGENARLPVSKRISRAAAPERGAVTVAIALASRQWAPQRGRLDCIGTGPGGLDQLTAAARTSLAEATAWVGYSLYLDLLEPLRRPDQLRVDGRLTEEQQRCDQALDLAGSGLRVALISSGDSGIYGMAGLALSRWLQRPEQDRPSFRVQPGISAFQQAAARVGAPLMHDLCTISLSDRLTPWPRIRERLEAAAMGDFVVALYNPRSRDRDWQLQEALTILSRHRPATTPVLLARQLDREGESLAIHPLDSVPVEQVDMLTLVLVGNSSTSVREGVMLTPRGYPGAEIQ